ncbi:type II toxin-antitoxin system RelE family toxin [Egibacter rhizosphaerae]|uniref:type II toxin-antitoxin system RelE family toxin n=1 Tax=Egibacter rhizosphaerae TaxID=1670831 RepID=UPI0013F17761|nr:type II toxin-antitoxin system mRNA interferase toxin, RelE/StbE family [Egibacter rhizosphaerae]
MNKTVGACGTFVNRWVEEGPEEHIGRAAGHRLRGRLTGLRSYRVGSYRIIYQLRNSNTVRVVAIRHRGHAYGTDPR